jgi:hypothetical protein
VTVFVAEDAAALFEVLLVEHVEDEALGDAPRCRAAPLARRFTMAPTRVSATRSSFTFLPFSANSSPISVSVAPAALPMPSARCPALRPIAMTKYQRDVVFASTIRFLTISTPTCRAVWKPKVSTSRGQVEVVVDRLRHVDDVDASPLGLLLELIAEKHVSSPPMVTR